MSASDPELGVGGLMRLRAAGLVSARRYAASAAMIRDEALWATWGLRAVLALGAGQFLAGVVFFFAYNWGGLSDIAKFAVVETALLIAAAGALIAGIDRAFGQVLLIAASVLTGVLLAVIGQVYQTGADAFELFAAWAVLILPWVIVSRCAAHWLVWLAVAETALSLYGEQVLTTVGRATQGQVWVLVGLTLAAALAARETAVRSGFDWLSGEWTRLVVLFSALSVLFLPAAAHVLDFQEFESRPLCLTAFLLVLLAAGTAYWRLRFDFAALVMVIGFTDAFFICVGYRLIDAAIGFDFDEAVPALAGFGAMIAWAIAGTGGAALAMRRLRNNLKSAPA